MQLLAASTPRKLQRKAQHRGGSEAEAAQRIQQLATVLYFQEDMNAAQSAETENSKDAGDSLGSDGNGT